MPESRAVANVSAWEVLPSWRQKSCAANPASRKPGEQSGAPRLFRVILVCGMLRTILPNGRQARRGLLPFLGHRVSIQKDAGELMRANQACDTFASRFKA